MMSDVVSTGRIFFTPKHAPASDSMSTTASSTAAQTGSLNPPLCRLPHGTAWAPAHQQPPSAGTAHGRGQASTFTGSVPYV